MKTHDLILILVFCTVPWLVLFAAQWHCLPPRFSIIRRYPLFIMLIILMVNALFPAIFLHNPDVPVLLLFPVSLVFCLSLLLWKIDPFMLFCLTGSCAGLMLSRPLFGLSLSPRETSIYGAGNSNPWLILIFISSLLLSLVSGIFLLLLIRRNPDNRKKNIRHVLWPIFTLSGFFSILILFLKLNDSQLNSSSCLLAFLFSLVISFSYCFMKITREKLSQTSYLKEITALQEKYLHLQNAYRSNARFVHDISAHLQSIASLAASGKTERVLSYIDSLNLDPALSAGTLPGLSVQDKAAKITAYTGLDLIDLILNDFCLQAKSRSVSITITASLLPVDSRISDKDFSSLFVNLLKNALENAGNWITVTIKPVQEMLFLQVINDFPGEIRLSGNLLLTTKENSLDHGFGTVLVQEICRKYDGYALFTSDNRTFSAEILITL